MSISGTLSNGSLLISGYTISAPSSEDSIKIMDLASITFYTTGVGNVYLSTGLDNTSSSPYVQMYVSNKGGYNSATFKLATPQYGGICVKGGQYSSYDFTGSYSTSSGCLFFPFHGATLYLWLNKNSKLGYYSGTGMSNGYTYNTVRFDNKAIFMITPVYNSGSSTTAPTPAGKITITSGPSSGSITTTSHGSYSNIVFGYIIIEVSSASPWITICYMNSSGTWAKEVTSSSYNYYAISAENCSIARIV